MASRWICMVRQNECVEKFDTNQVRLGLSNRAAREHLVCTMEIIKIMHLIGIYARSSLIAKFDPNQVKRDPIVELLDNTMVNVKTGLK